MMIIINFNVLELILKDEDGLKNIQDSIQFVMRRKFTLLFFYILWTVCGVAQEYTNYLCPKPENGKYYYINIWGERVTEAIYDISHIFYPPYTVVDRNGESGILDSLGKEIIQCGKYDYLDHVFMYDNDAPDCLPKDAYRSLFVCKREGKFGVIDIVNGQLIIPIIYDYIDNAIMYDGTALCKKNGKCGGLNIRTGKQTIPFDYDRLNFRVTLRPYNLIYCYKKSSGAGFIDIKGNVIIPLVHDYTSNLKFQKDGYIILKNRHDDSWFCYNSKGKKVKIGKYNKDDFLPFGEGRIGVKQNGKWGLINCENGKLVVPCIYDDMIATDDVGDGIGAVRQNTKGDGWALISKDGKILTDFILSNVVFFRLMYCDPCFIRATNIVTGKSGAFNRQGKMIIPFEYEAISYAFNKEVNLFPIKMNGKWGVVDSNNNVVIPAMYDGIRLDKKEEGNEGLIPVSKDKRWGYINYSNQLVVPFNYEYTLPFSDGLGEAINNDKSYFIDYHGNILWECVTYGDEYRLKKFQYLYSLEPSDVDKNIPVGNIDNRNTFVVIIANEKYTEQGVSQVQFAQNDGKIFKDYCTRTLGVPLKNIKCVENATINQMRSSINWVCDMANALDNEANVILYYSGHGVPDEKTGNAYLLPSDGIANDIRSAFSLDELYLQLGNLHTQKTMLFLDACFSGTTKEGNMMLADSRGVAIKSKSAQPKGNMIVLSAAEGDETAFPYKKKKHGMFTYFLLKKLQETKGNVLLGELSSYINKNVSRNSVLEMGKRQTPTVNVSVSFQNSDWKNKRLK